MTVVEVLGHICKQLHLCDVPDFVIIFANVVVVMVTYFNIHASGLVSSSRQWREEFYQP